MRKSDAFHTTILGMTGSGKSTLSSLFSNERPRKIVVDYMAEWTHGTVVRTFDQFCSVFEREIEKPQFTILIRFGMTDTDKQIIKLLSDIFMLVYQVGLENEIDFTIVCEEAHFYFPNWGMAPVMKRLITTGRHAHISLIANSQRPAELSKLFISQSKEIYIGSLFDAGDLDYVRATLGREAVAIVQTLQPLQFYHYPVGRAHEAGVIYL